MKITPLRTAALASAALAILSISSTPASAAVYVQVGVPPPPVVVQQPWARPYPGAVWIAPHNEWNGGRWVYVGGYYGYPPRRGAYYVPARYHHGYYYPGYWR